MDPEVLVELYENALFGVLLWFLLSLSVHWVCAGQYATRAWDIISLDAHSNPASVCSHIAQGETQRGWIYYEASWVAQRVKNPAGMQETRVQSLDWQDPWRREWQSTPIFLPGQSHGQRNLVGYSPWGRTESDKAEATERAHAHE